MVLDQDSEDRTNFLVLQRFTSVQAMSKHQNAAAFKDFTADAAILLAEPLGLYATNEREGALSEPVYPFGPAGEGGRDDAIYSSPRNIQGGLQADYK